MELLTWAIIAILVGLSLAILWVVLRVARGGEESSESRANWRDRARRFFTRLRVLRITLPKGPKAFWVMIGLYLMTSMSLVVLSLLIGEQTNNEGFSLWKTTVGLILAHLVLSIQTSTKDEQPILEVLGYPVEVLGPGPHFVPFGIARLDRFPTTSIQLEIPDEIENIHFGDGDVPEGKTEPLRVTAGGSSRKEADSLDRPMTLEPVLIARIRIIEPMAFKEATGTVENALRQVEDSLVITLQGAYANRTPREVFKEWADIDTLLEQKLEERTGDRCPTCRNGTHTTRIEENGKLVNVCETQMHLPKEGRTHKVRVWWGVDVLESSLKVPGLPHGFNKALRDTASSVEEANQITIKAPAEETRLKAIGRGEGDAIRSKGIGEADARAAEMRALGIKDGRDLIAVRALAELGEKANVFIGGGSQGGDIENLVKLVTAKTARDQREGGGDNAD